jgi:hypothetical protein
VGEIKRKDHKRAPLERVLIREKVKNTYNFKIEDDLKGILNRRLTQDNI